MNSVKDIIRTRRSIRTFNGEPLRPDDREKLEEFFQNAENPFGIPVEFRFLDAKEHGLSSPVILGTDEYVAAKVKRIPRHGLALGYTFETFCLFAGSLGIGTVMLAGTLNRSAFERGMELEDDEVMPVASPVGYVAEKMSVREKLMRKGIKADERLPFDTLFFENSFDHGLTPAGAGIFKDALEMIRLAPSAVNKQPWRAVVTGEKVHFYGKRTKVNTGGLYKVDMGIALAHFDLTMKENGIEGTFVAEDPCLETDDLTEYIITYTGGEI